MATPYPATLDSPRPRALPSPVRRALTEAVTIGGFILAVLLSNYLLISLPGIKLFDLLVFVAGYRLGLRRAAIVAGARWAVYGVYNPWGPPTPGLIPTVAVSETVYGLAGMLCARFIPAERLRLLSWRGTLAFAALAAGSTLLYDVATNIYTGIYWAQIAGGDYTRWLLVAVTGPGALLFSAVHVGANVALFPALGPAMCRGVSRLQEVLPWR